MHFGIWINEGFHNEKGHKDISALHEHFGSIADMDELCGFE